MKKLIEQSIYDIANELWPMPPGGFEPLIKSMKTVSISKNQTLIHAAKPNELEYFLISGILRSFLISAEGDDTTLAFHVGPCIFTPSIARAMDGLSLVSCEAMENSEVVSFPGSELITLMMQDRQIQAWGDSVLRAEIVKRAAREHMLASMSGKARLIHFREHFPDLEARVPHPSIASYLGMSAVSLSRLRSQHDQNAT